jgi:hypothetical protein
MHGFSRLLHPRHDPEVSRQFAFIGKIVDVADDREQDRGRQVADPLDRFEILEALQLRAQVADLRLQFLDACVQAADLLL